MNYYVVVEGARSERDVYSMWIPFLNPRLSRIDDIAQFTVDNFLIVSGNGFPFYHKVIQNAAEDVAANPQIGTLVVAVDSEDMTYQDKYKEIETILTPYSAQINYSIVVQHFCLETWALGNRLLLVSRNIQDETLRKYKDFFDVSRNDPEMLPAYTQEMGRVEFAYRYLRRAIRNKYRTIVYSKSDPNIISESEYFHQILSRHRKTSHLPSFRNLVETFSP